uniref:Uncharacterized protein n=1 Tax=Sus scrofa TaxID=9823 RepID=A0A8D1B6W7_PIG
MLNLIRFLQSLTVLEARNPKSRCQQGQAPSDAPRGESFLAFSCFGWRLAFFGSSGMARISASASKWPLPLCFCILISLSFLQ